MSQKIIIPQNTFGKYLRFQNTPEEWEAEGTVWFSVWVPGKREELIVRAQCVVVNDQWCYMIEEGKFDTQGIYAYELCQYIADTLNDVSVKGELEVVESAKKPSG